MYFYFSLNTLPPPTPEIADVSSSVCMRTAEKSFDFHVSVKTITGLLYFLPYVRDSISLELSTDAKA